MTGERLMLGGDFLLGFLIDQRVNGRVILPFNLLRRLDCVLEFTKSAVQTELADKKKLGVNSEPPAAQGGPELLQRIDARPEKKLLGDSDHFALNLFSYSAGYLDQICIRELPACR